jgi:hypothetical protein
MIGDDVGMESESPSIDPRYRPEYQRGYTGGTAPVPPAPVPPAPVPPAPVPPAAADRANEPIHDELNPAARIDVESPAVADPPIIESEPAKRRRNPYFLAIPLTGLGSVGLGGWLTVSQWTTNFSVQSESSNTVESRFGQAMIFAFSSPLITVGLASLFGFGFWLAVRRRS